MSLLRLITLASLCVALAQAQDIAGRVVEDTSGNPVASAGLKLRKDGQRELEAELETDGSGRFRAEGVAAGEYTLEVSKPNYVSATMRVHLPNASLAVRLVKFGVITGHARDSIGAPLARNVMEMGGRTKGGARIGVLAKIPGGDGFRMARMISLGQDGAYRVFDLPPGEYAVGLWYSALPAGSGALLYPSTAQPRTFAITGAEEYRDVDFTVPVQASFTVSGAVSGGPAVAARTGRPPTYVVSLGLPEAPWIPVAQLWTETNGIFRFENIPAGNYELYASGPTRGYGAYDSMIEDKGLFGRTRVSVSGQDVKDVQVAVSGGLSLEVTARAQGSGKKPDACPGSVPILLTSVEPWSAMLDRRVDASFEKASSIPDLAPGRYRLSGRDMGGRCFSMNDREIDLRSQNGPAAIEVAAAGQLRGQLRGQVKAGDYAVALFTMNASPDALARFAHNDDQGRFTFDALAPGKYRLAIQPAGARWSPDLSKMIELDIAGGTPTDLELPAPAIAR